MLQTIGCVLSHPYKDFFVGGTMEETDKTSQGVHLSDEEDADMDQGSLLSQGECRLLEF